MFRWTLHLSGGPTKRFHDAAIAVEHKVYYFKGLYHGNTAQIDVHVFNTVSLRWAMFPPVTTYRGDSFVFPSKWWGYTAVLIEGAIYIWGGYTYCNGLYAFDVDAHKWFKPMISGTIPEGRKDHSACVLGKVMYIYGGSNSLSGDTNDIYKLDSTTMIWSLINTRGTPPSASSDHSATIIGTKMFVFGGRRGPGVNYDNIRVFETETNCWLSTPSAQLLILECKCPSAFAYNGELYIFGGQSHDQFFNVLCKFNPETFSWKKVEPKGKGPSKKAGMCCMVGDRIVLFGGWSARDDLYVLDLSPSLETLCKLAVVQYDLELSELPHNIRWELAAMTTTTNNNNNRGEENGPQKKKTRNK